jgi:hypothetical protein
LDKRKEFQSVKRKHFAKMAQSCCNCDSTDDLHVHHIVPLALGGTNKITNLAVVCGSCHARAHGFDRTYNHTQSVIDGQRRTMDSGRWSTGLPAYGYTVGIARGVIVINESEAEIVRLVYRWRYVTKLKLTDIVDALNGMAINGRYEGSAWNSSTITQILKRYDVYLGGQHRNVQFPQILDDSYQQIIESFNQTYENKRFRKNTQIKLALDHESDVFYFAN